MTMETKEIRESCPMQKRKILIVIDNLRKGGAEVLLTGILPDLNEKFEVILVTLSDECDFTEEEIECKKKYSLGFKNKFYLLSCVWKLKKIIKKQKPSIIHSHLFYSSLISRLSCPRDIPLIYSLHNEMSRNVFNNSKILTILEKKTIKKNHSVMAVSKNVLQDYENTFGEMNNSYVIENFILDKFFTGSPAKDSTNSEKLKLIAVGNIKNQKNYGYMVKAFENLKGFEISIDIYGHGNDTDFKKLQAKIEEKDLPIFLKGGADNIDKILPNYDLYVSCSSYEGFGISVIEAMASGLPLLLSDLPVYHEVTMDNALFFDVENPLSLVTLIKEILDGKLNFKKLSLNGIEISKKYTKEIYLDKLLSIYDDKLIDHARKF